MNLGGSRLLDRKSRNILESIWTGYTWIGTKKRWNKSMAKRIFTTIARAMGQQNRSEVYNLNFNWHWLALKPHMFLISLPINKNNSKIVFHVKEQGATCPSIILLQYHMPSTWSYSWLPAKNYNMFSGSNRALLQHVFLLSHVIQSSSYKMASQPNHINPYAAFKKLLCYKMVAQGTFLKPCFTDKMD